MRNEGQPLSPPAPASSPLRTETAFQAVPVLRMAYFPIPHRPTFGAPVFRSAYSASRNARASAAFAASIEAHCAVCRETLMLQVRCGYRGAKLRVLMPPLCKGRCRTDEGRLTEGLLLSREITLGTTTPQSGSTPASSPLRTETAFQAVPVLRMAYFAQEPHRGFCSKTLMLQVRFARPTGTGEPNCASLCLPCVRGGVGRTKDV